MGTTATRMMLVPHTTFCQCHSATSVCVFKETADHQSERHTHSSFFCCCSCGFFLFFARRSKGGFYLFIVATMASILSTHIIIHYHRRVHYCGKAPDIGMDDDEPPRGNETTTTGASSSMRRRRRRRRLGVTGGGGGDISVTFVTVATVALFLAMGLYLTGTLVRSFEITNTRGSSSFATQYSIVSLGQSLLESNLDPSDAAGTRFIQAMWFFLGVAMPLWCCFLLSVLFLAPLGARWTGRIFVMAEVASAWSCAEVLVLSTVFAVLQMPTIGEGLIEADCLACFVVTTRFLPGFAYLCVAAVLLVGLTAVLHRRAHFYLYKE
jgi:hypothetical protein